MNELFNVKLNLILQISSFHIASTSRINIYCNERRLFKDFKIKKYVNSIIKNKKSITIYFFPMKIKSFININDKFSKSYQKEYNKTIKSEELVGYKTFLGNEDLENISNIINFEKIFEKKIIKHFYTKIDNKSVTYHDIQLMGDRYFLEKKKLLYKFNNLISLLNSISK
ncbi:hypothetical protein (nucleomorph) [Guillardia theta]|uniref:Uncharacterized protein n=1 Tax=Guillardia theta TaxID=55529 RepID=Q98RQ3_GUITH|nr:hypothetical protein GTHECHR1100 [Guillardia theta]AAK39893.1 hypothetical protein [Guillardia theta]